MNRDAGLLGFCMSAAVVALSCADIPTGGNALLSFTVAPLGSPGVVVGDTLRDSTGAVAPIKVTAFNFENGVISDVPVRFLSTDRTVRVDSLTGIVAADSLRNAPVRIIIAVERLQTGVAVDVTLRPDTVAGANARDSLSYSLTDTTSNLSRALTVQVLHGLASADSAVRSWVVSFRILSPLTPDLARLVDEGGKLSSVDTTDAAGIAGRRIRLRPVLLTALSDSVIVQAAVKYRGQPVRGSPVRLVLKAKPGSP